MDPGRRDGPFGTGCLEVLGAALPWVFPWASVQQDGILGGRVIL